jgi:hypothetical protein
MAKPSDTLEVYVEKGSKRVFAGLIEWPGWCRSGRDEAAALQALVDYGPRYARVLRKTELEFRPPADVAAFRVVQRLKGGATTDFGSPGEAPSSDKRPFNQSDLGRERILLKACWRAFDAAVKAASGAQLRKGPRGGGRELEQIVRHVLEADGAYLGRLAWKIKIDPEAEVDQEMARTRRAVVAALESAVQHRVPERGPRGGTLWTPRYFVRRVAWHVLDHAWEIEDRTV